MPRYAFRIEYDGAPFSGWQRQASVPSVQAAIEAALARIDPTAPLLAAAGRTDTGVHATHQVAHCDLSRDWDTFRLSGAINHHLRPAPVAITAIAPVADDWHARFSATGRRYFYRIIQRRPPLVHERGRAWRVSRTMDVAAMREGAAHLIGHHDFTTFRSTMCQAPGPMKTLDRIEIDTQMVGETREIHLRFAARSFLHNQVRSMVGTLERVGAGGWAPDDVRAALQARDRNSCGPVAPPEGLYLSGVTYDADPFATL